MEIQQGSGGCGNDGGGAKNNKKSGSGRSSASSSSSRGFFDSPAAPDEIKRRVAAFLTAGDAVRLSGACKSLRSALVLAPLGPPATALWDRPVALDPGRTRLPGHDGRQSDTSGFLRVSPHPLPLPVSPSKIHSVRVRVSWQGPPGATWDELGTSAYLCLVGTRADAAPASEAASETTPATDTGGRQPAAAPAARAPPPRPGPWGNGGAGADRVVGEGRPGSPPTPWHSPEARRVRRSPAFERSRGDGTVELSFHPRAEESYHLWYEFASSSSAEPLTRRDVALPSAEMSVVVFDDNRRTLSSCHAALSAAGALPPLPRVHPDPDERTVGDQSFTMTFVRGGLIGWRLDAARDPAAGGLGGFGAAAVAAGAAPPPPPPRLPAAAQQPPGFFTEMLLASCRLLLRRLELLSAGGSGGGDGEGCKLPGLGSELAAVLEGIGIEATEPSLRAVEELVEENARRRAEHRALSGRILAEQDEARRRRLQEQQDRRRQQQRQRQLHRGARGRGPPDRPGNANDGGGAGLGALAMRMEAGGQPQVFDPDVGDWLDAGLVADRQAVFPDIGDWAGAGLLADLPAAPAAAAPANGGGGGEDLPDEVDGVDDDDDGDAAEDFDGNEHEGVPGLVGMAGFVMEHLLRGRRDRAPVAPPAHVPGPDGADAGGPGAGDDGDEDMADLPALEEGDNDLGGGNNNNIDGRRFQYWNGEAVEIVD